ncbi:hypothetical protein KIM372_17130 [Bombiscardovia nodaiensis]|uniref:Probable multidrug resistance protein NorM n=1 Tax=Bombiscardovia nodaiensis TaxID=2932181 RepID=A0ABN6SF31_9BIFI|nr:hypothetical protein KIM372_17130 [Bombiscardovia nodaiensis]
MRDEGNEHSEHDSSHSGPVGAAAPVPAAATALSRRSVYRQITALAIPTFGQLIAEPAFVMIDTAIVGHISDAAMAGLSIGSTVVLTTVGLCVFLAYGTTSKVAQLMGAGKRKEGMEVGIDGMWLAFGIGIVVCALLVAFSTPLCHLMGARGPSSSPPAST